MSLGQGQEAVAESALDVAAEMGHWVILQVWGAPRPGAGWGPAATAGGAGAPPCPVMPGQSEV